MIKQSISACSMNRCFELDSIDKQPVEQAAVLITIISFPLTSVYFLVASP